MDKVDFVIKKYSDFLNLNWDLIEALFEIKADGISVNYLYEDWLQVNWELLVGSVLSNKDEYLMEYGSPDYVYFNPKDISNKNQLLVVKCSQKDNEEVIDLFTGKNILLSSCDFVKFVGFNGGKKYANKPPFNFVLLEDENSELFIVNKDDIIFELFPAE